VADVAFWSFWS